MAHIFAEGERTKDVTLSENVTFDSLLLPRSILEGLKSDGFVKPSPIQLRAIPVGRCGLGTILKFFLLLFVHTSVLFRYCNAF